VAFAATALGLDAGEPHTGILALMADRIRSLAGTLTTITAGVLVGILALSAFGPTTTLLVFFVLAVLASVAQRALSQR
jgi:dolichol kinase